jgi:hypothetical protein
MATDIKSWSSTAGSNNATPPNGAPEGMAPSAVNNVIRQNMKSVRDWYIDPAWVDFGYTYAYVGTDEFKIAGTDVSADFPVGRRVRAIGSTTGTIYGTISAVAFSTDTSVTVTFDSGNLENETLAVSVGVPSLGSPIAYSLLSLVGQITLADMANLAEARIIGRAAAAGTGVPTSLTATQLKAILDTVFSFASQGLTINTQTANYTLVLGDGINTIVEMNSASTRTVTVPPNSDVAFPVGTQIPLTRYGAGSLTVVAGSGVTINTASTLVLRSQYSMASLYKRGTNEWVIAGDLEPA